MIESMDALDSPSRQLLRELSQLHIDDQRFKNQQLEKRFHDLNASNKKALEAAAAKHERVRQEAEAVREHEERRLAQQQLQREIEHQKRLKELERLKQQEAERQAALERERAEAAKAKEAAEKAAVEERQARLAAAEQARIAKEKREAEEARAAAEKQEREKAAEAKAKEDAENAARARAKAALASRAPAPTPATFATVSAPQTSTGSVPQVAIQDREPEHQRYLMIHQNLKKLRRFMLDQGKRNPSLKKKMSEPRREIRKRVGQLTDDNQKNREAMRVIINLLKESLSFADPQVNVLDYLRQPPPNVPSPANGPCLLLYLLNIFSKSLISQFLSEASVSTKTANPIGIIGSTIFAQTEFQWNGIPLTDILLAKFHAKCPVLFGIYGDENTAQGKQRLGWQQENGAFVGTQRHAERMWGLGSGFAALSLRSFAKSKLNNPLPTWHFWGALAAIVNVPPEKVTATHFYVLKAMVEHNVPRILEFFGMFGKAALAKAVLEFPKNERWRDHTAAKSVGLLKDIWAKELKLYLEPIR